MIPAPTRYSRARDLDHAFELLAEPEAMALAGGQSLLPTMKLRIARPELVVDVSPLPLRGIELRDSELHLGPLTTWRELAEAPELRRGDLAAVAECARDIGDLQVRNRGTLGGSLAHADPASDMPAVLLALGAALTLRSAEGERTVALHDFFLGPFTTALGPGELITDVAVPVPGAGSGSAYVSLEHHASGFALAGAAAVTGPGGASVAFTGIATVPFGLESGAELEDAVSKTDVFGDRFASAEYRRHLALVVARRALDEARTRAGEGS